MTRAILLACLIGSLCAVASAQPLSYADLMKAPPEQRQPLFESLTPENRAQVIKQRWEAWLVVHEPDLTRGQIALVREAIAMVTPDGAERAGLENRDRMGHRLWCALGGDLASTLGGFSEPRRLRRTWSQSARNWIDWAVSCVI